MVKSHLLAPNYESRYQEDLGSLKSFRTLTLQTLIQTHVVKSSCYQNFMHKELFLDISS